MLNWTGICKTSVKQNNHLLEKKRKTLFWRILPTFTNFYKKYSPTFYEKVSRIGNKWQLDIEINESWLYFEPPIWTRANKVDQETSAEFKGWKPLVWLNIGRSYRHGTIWKMDIVDEGNIQNLFNLLPSIPIFRFSNYWYSFQH